MLRLPPLRYVNYHALKTRWLSRLRTFRRKVAKIGKSKKLLQYLAVVSLWSVLTLLIVNWANHHSHHIAPRTNTDTLHLYNVHSQSQNAGDIVETEATPELDTNTNTNTNTNINIPNFDNETENERKSKSINGIENDGPGFEAGDGTEKEEEKDVDSTGVENDAVVRDYIMPGKIGGRKRRLGLIRRTDVTQDMSGHAQKLDHHHRHHHHHHDPDDSSRYLIYRCGDDVMGSCSGLADSLTGMMTAYVIANLTGRVFKAEIAESGCDLRDFLSQHNVNWTLHVPFHPTIPTSASDVTVMKYVDDLSFYSQLSQMNFSTLPQMQAKYVYFRTNYDHTDAFRETRVYQAELAWMKGLSRAEINAAIFHHLFKPSRRMQTLLGAFAKHLLAWAPGKLVCAHVQMTGNHPSFPENSAYQKMFYSLPGVWSFIFSQVQTDNDRVFFMSDSKAAIYMTSQQSFTNNLIYTEEFFYNNEHSKLTKNYHNNYGIHNNNDNDNDDNNDRNLPEQKCQELEKLVFDFLVLTHCDVLIISRGGLSRTAAYVRGSDVGLYCLVDRQVLPCKRTEIKSLYKVMR